MKTTTVRVHRSEENLSRANQLAFKIAEVAAEKALRGETQPSNEQIAFASLMRGVHW